GEPRGVQVRVEPVGGGDGEWRVRIASRAIEPEGPWETHFECRLLRGLAQSAAAERAKQEVPSPGLDGDELDGDALDVDALIGRMGRRGIQFGPAFRALHSLRRSG